MSYPQSISGPSAKTRTPHHKSRQGCSQCKQKKVKCDERKPICTRCEVCKTSCSFLLTHPQKGNTPGTLPAPDQELQSQSTSPLPWQPSHEWSSRLPQPSYGVPASFSLLDMQLLYSWVTEGAAVFSSFSDFVIVFQKVAVEVAFEHQFLMHELLSLSALHLSKTSPQEASKYLFSSDKHNAAALAMFQPEVVNINPTNCEACYLFSMLTFVHAWGAQDAEKPSTLFFIPRRFPVEKEAPIKWVRLHRGARSILQSHFPVIKAGRLKQLFAAWAHLDSTRGDDELEANDKRHLEHLAEVWTSSSLPETQKEALNEMLGTTRRTFSLMTFYPQISKLAAVMSWFSQISDELLVMLENKVPEALILVAYYCVAMNRLPPLWWIDGKAEGLLKTVLDEVGDDWEQYTAWPIEQVMKSKIDPRLDRMTADTIA
ncbi:hypothetical protein BJ875DRAFT_117926 [Amylocarpus encephaloides]|uniref:Zn(2)-C6 fungal-type domain-containing protein n=1 Tax=Amylocarpus encephaloides TaxID=45428 RepID=A0A9P7YDG7_9HELO|nr:hypothetical protein BJ875DRAFT_117926 [Amylocarpus encephaloides]